MPNIRLAALVLPIALLSACGQGETTAVSKPHADVAAPKTNFTGQTWGTAEQREVVRGYIEKLMDVTRIVPDSPSKKGGPRGSPGSYAALSGPDREEFISSIIHVSERFLPKSLKDEEKWALVCAEISIESAFKPGTRGINPGDNRTVSVSPIQITVRGQPEGPGMWEDIFVQYADIAGLTHYDGSPWDIKGTGAPKTAELVEHSIWDGLTAGFWAITEMGRRGVPDYLGSPNDGPCPKTWKYAQWAWVIGGPALKSGGDLNSQDGSGGQKIAYILSQETDLKLLGFDVSLLDTPF